MSAALQGLSVHCTGQCSQSALTVAVNRKKLNICLTLILEFCFHINLHCLTPESVSAITKHKGIEN